MALTESEQSLSLQSHGELCSWGSLAEYPELELEGWPLDPLRGQNYTWGALGRRARLRAICESPQLAVVSSQHSQQLWAQERCLSPERGERSDTSQPALLPSAQGTFELGPDDSILFNPGLDIVTYPHLASWKLREGK